MADGRRWRGGGARWQVQRERCRIRDSQPPADFHEARPIGAIIPQVLRAGGLQDQAWLLELQAAWPELVGEEVARHARAGRYESGRLTVFVDSSAWLEELSRYSRGLFLGKLQERFGAGRVAGLIFRLDPDADRGGRPPADG